MRFIWLLIGVGLLAQESAPPQDEVAKFRAENVALKAQVAALQSSLKSAMRALNGCLAPDAQNQQ